MPPEPGSAQTRPPPAPPGRERWYFRTNLALLLGLLAAVALAQLATVTDGHVVLFGWPVPETCMYRRLFGRPCPGCGLTRSAVLALRRQWAASARTHPSGIALAAYLAAQLLARAALLIARPAGRGVRRADLTLSLAGLFAVIYAPIVLAHAIHEN